MQYKLLATITNVQLSVMNIFYCHNNFGDQRVIRTEEAFKMITQS